MFQPSIKIFLQGRGAYVWDVAGNKYVDLFLGSGTVILGHCDRDLLRAIRLELDEGLSLSIRHPAEVEVAEWLIRNLSVAGRAAYFKTGSEAVYAALRISHRVTKRAYVLSMGYHGWLPPFGD